MISSRLAVLIAAALVATTSAAQAPAPSRSFTVVSVENKYPYYGMAGNGCPRGAFFVHAKLGEPQDGLPAAAAVVLRLVDATGLKPGDSLALADVRKAGAGPDGTVVFCAQGPGTAAAPPPPPPPLVVAPVGPEATTPADSAETASATAKDKPAKARCAFRTFNIIKPHLGGGHFGPSEFDPTSLLSGPDASGPVACSVARARVSNVALVKLVKARFEGPGTLLGAEWAAKSSWEKVLDDSGEPTQQKRAAKIYVLEQTPEMASAR